MKKKIQKKNSKKKKKNRRRPPKRKRAGTLNMYIFLHGLIICHGLHPCGFTGASSIPKARKRLKIGNLPLEGHSGNIISLEPKGLMHILYRVYTLMVPIDNIQYMAGCMG